MNIKAVWNSLTNLAGVSTQKLDKKRKLEASDEKESQLGYGDEEATNNRMTQEEAEQALEKMRSINGFKDNNLNVRLEKHNERYIVFVEDPSGKVIRRIPENELWFFLKRTSAESKKGHILNKTG